MKILILGLGWLGRDIALKLASLNHEIIGTKRNIDHSMNNIDQISWTSENNLPKNLSADVCIITLTPSAITDLKKFHENLILLSKIGVKKFIYTSSSGIYEGLEGVVDEQSKIKLDTVRIKKLYDIEQIVLKQNNPVVLRLAGLVGDDRIPARFLAGKKDVSGAKQKINMVHKNDVINIVILLLNTNFNGVMNLVASAHQTREEYYNMLCDHYNLERPQFNDTIEKVREVSNALSKRILNYNYEIDDTLVYFLN